MATIGQELGGTRRDKGLTVEDVAHETRIHPTMIRSIEEDDFSMFASVAYAKSFIRNYSEYLGLDLSDAMETLNDSVSISLSENELLDEMKKTIRKDSNFRSGRRPKLFRRRLDKPGGAPIFLNFILAVLIGGLIIFYFLGYNASTPDEAKSGIANGLKKANPFSRQTSSEEIVIVNDNKPIPSLPNPAEEAGAAEVRLKFEDELPTLSGDGGNAYPPLKPATLKPIETPTVIFSDDGQLDVNPADTPDAPARLRPPEEPKPDLRPAGTDPVSTAQAPSNQGE